MEDILLICLLAAFFIFGYVQMNKLDHKIQQVCKPKEILIVYDDAYKHMQNYANDKIICLNRYELWDFSQSFRAVVVCTTEDQYNLLLNYRIKRNINGCNVYAICYEKEYMNLYLKEKIHVIENDELIGLIGRLYEKDLETTH